jgi:hypothetical protein
VPNPTDSEPYGVAVDGAGDLFIAYIEPGKIVEVPAGCTTAACQTTVGYNLVYPFGVTVDAAGDLFVAEVGPSMVVEIPAGCSSATCQTTVGTGLVAPYDTAVDAAGDVFIVDAEANQLIEVNRSAPPSFTFPSTQVGQTSPGNTQSVTIQNIGTLPLNAVLPGLVVAEPNFTQVAGTGTPADCTSSFSLQPGDPCNVSIMFTPQVPGNPLTSTAAFTDNALNASPSTTQTINLQGVATAATYQLMTAANPTNGGVVTPPSGPFTANSIVPLTATPNAGFVFANWTGNVANPNSATTTITMNSAQNVTAKFVPVLLTASPSAFNFPNLAPLETYAKLILVENVGATKLTIGTATITSTGGDANAFTIHQFCEPATLKPAHSCYIGVTFMPHQLGLSTATMSVPFNGAGSPLQVPLTGTGIPRAGKVTASPTSFIFGNVPVGTTSNAQQITLSNTGVKTVTISNVSGLVSPFVVQSNNCPSELSPGAQCEVYVQFAPAETGLVSQTLVFTDSALDSPQSVTLSGMGD